MFQQNVSIDSLIDKLILNRTNNTDCLWQSSFPMGKTESVHFINHMIGYPLINDEYIDERRCKLEKYKNQLTYLKSIKKIEQRSEEWYNVRENLITASDFGQSLGKGKFSTQKQFFKKKCGFEEKIKFDPYIAPLKWGIMYEPIATKIYEKREEIKINEFGLLIHPTINYFGASPDGITDNGILLEVKCPYKRKITGEIPEQYIYQIQGQLDVCNLDECDYLECDFKEFDNIDMFFDEINPFERGIIIELKSEDQTPCYIYSKIYDKLNDETIAELRTWLSETQNTYNEKIEMIHFWKLKLFNIIRIYRDKPFLEENFKNLKVIWNKVKDYQQNKDLYDAEICTSKKGKPTFDFLKDDSD